MIPLPTPQMTRPAISWASEKAEHWRTAPTAIIREPAKMQRLRPRRSPKKIVRMAPTKQPKLYDETETPWRTD